MISGSLTALVTPMYKNGELDFNSLKKVVEFHIQNKTDGLVVVGTTGECATLSTKEKCQVIESVVNHVDGRIPVIAGTGINCTAKTISLTKKAKAIGVDASLLITPYYNKPTDKGLIKHFQMIAQSVDIPQILYNVPSRTLTDLTPELVQKLSKEPNIVGIKEATGLLKRYTKIRKFCGDDFAIYSGDDETALALLLEGANGVISVTSNIMPGLVSQLCLAVKSKKYDLARSIDKKLYDLHRCLFLESNPIPVKWLLKEMKLIQEGIRLPLLSLSSMHYALLKKAYDVANVD